MFFGDLSDVHQRAFVDIFDLYLIDPSRVDGELQRFCEEHCRPRPHEACGHTRSAAERNLFNGAIQSDLTILNGLLKTGTPEQRRYFRTRMEMQLRARILGARHDSCGSQSCCSIS